VYKVRAVDELGREGASAYSNNLIVGTPLTVPYGGEFADPADMLNYYTIVDNNEDRCTWSYDVATNSAVYEYNPEEDADDWLISPPIIYEKGVDYQMSFSAFSSSEDYPEALEVRCGADRNPANHTVLLLSVPEVPYAEAVENATEYTVAFTAPADGLYYYSVRCTSPAYHFKLYVRNLRVYKKGMDGISATLTAPSSASTMDVYTLAGMRVMNNVAASETNRLPAGVYVTKAADGTSRKIFVK